MTRYSVFERSQSDELPATLPELETLTADVTALAKWISHFDERPVTP